VKGIEKGTRCDIPERAGTPSDYGAPYSAAAPEGLNCAAAVIHGCYRMFGGKNMGLN